VNSAQILNTESGVENWHSRFKQEPQNFSTQNEFVDLSTGLMNQLVLAVPIGSFNEMPSTSSIKITMTALSQESQEYNQFTYKKDTSFNVINGVESGVAKKVLRYNLNGSTPSIVQVYLNGIKLTEDLDYELYRGNTSSAAPNSILFKNVISGALNEVIVIVSVPAEVLQKELIFNRAILDESRVGTGSFEGVDFVSSGSSEKMNIFYCDFNQNSTNFKVGEKLLIKSIHYSATSSSVPIQLTSGSFLFSGAGCTHLDRKLAVHVKAELLSNSSNYLSVKSVSGVKSIQVTKNSVQNVFPVLHCSTFSTDPILSAQSTIKDITSTQSSIIIGPM